MSISLATMGLFNNCCGERIVSGGGGAPPYRQYDEHVTPVVFVKKVEVKTIDSNDSIVEVIKVRLLVDGGK